MRFRLSSLLFLAVAAAAAMPACSCGGDDETSSGTNGSGSGGGGGSDPAGSVRVEPAAATVTVELGGAPATQAYKAFATVNGAEVEVTADCNWTIDPSFGSVSSGTVTAAAHGGTTQVVASCEGGATGSGDLTIDLAGTILVGAAPADAPDLFDAAPAGSDPARIPATVYPIDGAIAPRNLPPIDVQWLPAANDLFHVALTAPNLAIDLYTTDISAMLQDAEWNPIVTTAAGEDLQIEVEGLLLVDPSTKFVSAPVTFRISNDNLDKTALYYWASSKSSLMATTFGSTTTPAALKEDCTSCHSVSRSGSRIGYSRCVAGNCSTIRIGFMRFDKAANTWVDTLDANDPANTFVGSYTTFAPVGNPFPDDSQSVALVGMGGGTLQLFNPDTGTVVPSNAGQVATYETNGQPTRSALMPDWSPDGTQVVFASTPHLNQYIDLSDGAIATMSYTFDGTNHTFSDPKFIVSPPLTWPSGTYTNLFFPSFSPDGQHIVFNAARAAWRNGAPPPANAKSPGQRLALTDKTGSAVVELAKMNGEGDLDITWPHWAPTKEGEYLWVVFSSQRDYGHKVTEANSSPACKQNGVTQCKQLWIGAVDRKKLEAGLADDPSAPPVWMPGQDLDADNISPYWTVPTSEIPE